MPNLILCASPLAQYEGQKNDIQAAINRVLASGYYVLGPEVKAFEQEFAKYVGVNHGIGVANGTDALQIALVALGVGAGDEVITVAHTAVATTSAIVQTGAIPVFVDVSPTSFTMDPSALESARTSKTKAIVVVHLYGHPADLDPILVFAKKHRLFLIEDCAQAHGALYRGKRVGSYGDLGCFSFYPTKNLGALGDGGGIVTDNAEWAERVRLIRQYGWADRYISKIHGWNSRLDELQAAVLRVKLPRLDEDNRRRAELAALYRNGLDGLDLKLPTEENGVGHVYHLFAIQTERRDSLQKYLLDGGVQALIHYPMPIHRQPGYSKFCPDGLRLPVTENLARTELSLPLYPGLKNSEVEQVTRLICEYFRS